jgi:hypothetical protein
MQKTAGSANALLTSATILLFLIAPLIWGLLEFYEVLNFTESLSYTRLLGMVSVFLDFYALPLFVSDGPKNILNRGIPSRDCRPWVQKSHKIISQDV